jgi:pimeloyl-ACP methyl ester carboxylesterase/DNA-binding CsgD family transcriptional regulator
MSRQRIRYVRTSDGIQLAWAEAGSGPALVKAANWLSHLEYDWDSPVWRHWMRFLSSNFRYIRYDERGCGMSDRQTGDLSRERWLADLESVVEAARLPEPFALLGISQGAAICVAYAVRHPERVSALVLYGGYARGWTHRPAAPGRSQYQAIIELARTGWGKENPAFRQVFTSRFIPGGTPEQIEWWNDLCRKTTTPEIAAELLQSRADLEVMDQLSAVRAPTLVLHARDDQVCPVAEGRLLASGIPGAEFVELESSNHVLLEQEPAWPRFCQTVLEFLGVAAPRDGEHPAFAALSPREREILALISEGLGNAEIGERLKISEKTVRNHVSNLFDKLGVWTRAQAIVFARDHAFRP